MFCINCGEPLVEGTKFCPKCGTQQLNNQNMAPQQNQFAPVQPAAPNPFEAPVQQEAAPNPFEAPVQQEAAPNPFEAPVQQEAAPNPFEAPVQQEAAPNPFEAPIQQEAAPNPFEVPVQQEAAPNPFTQAAPQQGMGTQNPFEPQGTFQPQDSFQSQGTFQPQGGSFEPQQNGNQWGPMMQPEKKNKKPLIIGIIVALIAVIAVVVIILVIVFSSSKDKNDDKSTKTTKSIIETTTPVADSNVKDGEYEDSEIEEEAKTLLNQYMEAVVDKSLDDVKKVYLDSVYENMMSEYQEYEYTDEEIFEELQLVPESFGTVQKFTINDVKNSYCSDADDSFIERCGAKKDDNVLRYYSLDGTMTVESVDRTGTFEFSLYVLQTENSLTLYDVYGYGSTFTNYDYEFKGKGEDDFAEWYISDNDNEKETTTGGDNSVDQDELVQSVLDNIKYEGTGASSEKNIAEQGVKAILAKDYSQTKKYLMPLIVAMYDVFVDEGYFTEAEVEESVFGDIDVNESVDMMSISIDDTQNVDKADLEEEFEGLDMFGDAVNVDVAKTLDTTVKYKDSSDAEKTVGCQILIVKMSGNWYIADIAFDDVIE